MRPRAALEGKRDTARTCAPLAGHGAGALERVSPLERARGGTGLAEALERGGWRRGTVRLHVRMGGLAGFTHALLASVSRRARRPCLRTYAEKFLRPESIHTPQRKQRYADRRQGTGVVVVVWWWCKIRETARLAANGALLDE